MAMENPSSPGSRYISAHLTQLRRKTAVFEEKKRLEKDCETQMIGDLCRFLSIWKVDSINQQSGGLKFDINKHGDIHGPWVGIHVNDRLTSQDRKNCQFADDS